MAVPFAFATASGNIALSKLDSNFNTPITIGNTSVLLGNTITTLNNMTLANVTITSGTSVVTNVSVSNIVVTNLTATLANITTLNVASSFVSSSNIANANITNATITNLTLPTSLTVPNGGTGRVTLPVSSVLLGNGTGSFTSVDPGTTGNVLVSKGGAWVSNAFSTGFTAIVYSNATGVLSNVAIGTGLSFSTTTGVLVATGAVANAVTSVGNTYPILSTGGTTPTISFVDPGTTGNVLTSVGGVWISNAAVSSSSLPGGGNTTIQYNNANVFAGSANLTFNGTTLNAASINVSTGNLTFTTTGQKFVGDFTNATISNRTNFITGTANSTTGIYALPSGTSTAASWQATNNSDPTNASKVLIATNGTTDVQLVSGINGSGSYLPLALFNGGLGRFVIGTSGQFGVGPTATVSYGTSGQAFVSSGAAAAPAWGTLPVGGGGTGLTTIPTGNVIIGNGTSALYGIAPGTSGNVLTSIGGNWVSNAVVSSGGTSPGGSPNQVQFNNAGSFGGDANLTFSGSTLTSANLIVSNLTASLAIFSSSTKQLVSNPITGTSSVVMNASPIITTASLINPTVTNYTETRGTATVVTSPLALDLANGTFQSITTKVGSNSLTLPTPSAGKSLTVQVIYASTPTSLAFTSPSGSLKYPGAVTPTATLTNGQSDFYSFISDGTNWYGVQTGANF
jgi:hypothetical protein